jgi:hypothetical protein
MTKRYDPDADGATPSGPFRFEMNEAFSAFPLLGSYLPTWSPLSHTNIKGPVRSLRSSKSSTAGSLLFDARLFDPLVDRPNRLGLRNPNG